MITQLPLPALGVQQAEVALTGPESRAGLETSVPRAEDAQ